MSGGRESLIERAGRVVRDARSALPAPQSAISGGLMIYCAGCMLAISDDLDAVAAGIKAAFGEAPSWSHSHSASKGHSYHQEIGTVT